ncbi:hypothetical protein [Nocardia pseudobrasiliensis]|uniref:Uncharacterized protein n=1 Tax=Nocardia pseudobrasiliensis TaxID=45979 RepID=A0A370IBN5_9NOCA|nr:hypothetical protein [Nocardia pseudobrasiliensis]RDI68139.1 hypothetical protein DFR76_102540 [Nocardia pseudobrasiliensis]
MTVSDTRRQPRTVVRLVLLGVLLLPLLCGAVAVGFVSRTTDSGNRTVAIVGPAKPGPGDRGAKLIAALKTSPGYTWEDATATQAARKLSDRTVLAVVTIPDGFGDNSSRPGGPSTRPAAVAPTANRVTVVPSGDPADRDYARLEQAVSTTAVRVGIEGLLVSVSQSRTNLNVAALTAAGLKAAAANADGTVNDMLNTVKQLFGQTDPLVAQAQNLVAAMQQYSALIDELSGKLSTFAESMRGVTLTLGDLQNGVTTVNSGLDSVGSMLEATTAVRAQMDTVLRPIADVLRASGLPDGQRVGDQLTGLLTMVSGLDDSQNAARLDGLRVGAQLLDRQLQDLSGLLGKPVDAQTRLVDVLDLAVDRLAQIRGFMAQGDTTINQVVVQLNAAKQMVPTMESQIRGQIEQLKAVTAQLVVSLGTGVDGLPDTSAATAERLSQGGVANRSAAGSSTDTGLLRAVLALLLGALVIVLLQAATEDLLCQRGWAPRRAAIVSWALAAVLALALAALPSRYVDHRYAAALYGCAAAAVFAAVAMTTALLRLYGRVGLGLVIASIAATAAFDIGVDGDSAPGLRLLPGSYMLTGLDIAGSSGVGSALLPIVVLLACGGCAAAVRLLIPSPRRAPTS